jgi:hypothetical protein
MRKQCVTTSFLRCACPLLRRDGATDDAEDAERESAQPRKLREKRHGTSPIAGRVCRIALRFKRRPWRGAMRLSVGVARPSRVIAWHSGKRIGSICRARNTVLGRAICHVAAVAVPASARLPLMTSSSLSSRIQFPCNERRIRQCARAARLLQEAAPAGARHQRPYTLAGRGCDPCFLLQASDLRGLRVFRSCSKHSARRLRLSSANSSCSRPSNRPAARASA